MAASIFEQIKKYLYNKTLLSNCKLSMNFFTRSRLLPFPVLVSYIINLIRRSLHLEISAFASFINQPDVSKQAFSQARKKLSSEVFILLNKKLITEFYSDNEIKTIKGLRLLAIDGSTVRLPKSKELYNFFGSHKKEGSVPLARISVLYDVLNHLTLHAAMGPYIESEKNLAMKHFEELHILDNEIVNSNYKDLLIFDRGYPSHFHMFFLQSRNKHFLFRVSEAIGEIIDVIKSGNRDAVIDLILTKDKLYRMPDFAKYDLRDRTIKVRVTKFDLSSGKKEILVTSLIDQNEFTYDDLFALYKTRWNVEEQYKLYKCIANIENFSGESKLAIEQDFYATVFTCNAASLLSQEAQEELNLVLADKNIKYTYKINRNILIGTIKNEILEIFLGDQNLEEYCEMLKKRLKKSLVAVRPGRSNHRPTHQREGRPIINKTSL